MATREKYQAPSLQVMGRLSDLTLGGPGSRVDGNSGNVGNRGKAAGGGGNGPGRPWRPRQR